MGLDIDYYLFPKSKLQLIKQMCQTVYESPDQKPVDGCSWIELSHLVKNNQLFHLKPFSFWKQTLEYTNSYIDYGSWYQISTKEKIIDKIKQYQPNWQEQTDQQIDSDQEDTWDDQAPNFFRKVIQAMKACPEETILLKVQSW